MIEIRKTCERPPPIESRCVVGGHPRTIKRSPRRRPNLTQVWQAEQRGIEGRLAVARIGSDVQVTGQIVGRIHTVIVDAVRNRAQQRRVVVVGQGHGKSGAEPREFKSSHQMGPAALANSTA